jgi:hypothetical protein
MSAPHKTTPAPSSDAAEITGPRTRNTMAAHRGVGGV